MLIFIKNILVIFILLFSSYTFSSSSSSYLVSNTAINLFDFDKAKEEFEKLDNDLNESDLHNQLLTYISLNLLLEANLIAKEIIKINQSNQEAWIVYLANAISQNDLSVFNEYKLNQSTSEMVLLNYIFFF